MHRPTYGEVIKVLVTISSQAEEPVQFIVEKAADASGPHACCFGLEIEHLTEDARLPVQSLVEPGPIAAQAGFKFGDHGQGKRSIGRDVLATGDIPGHSSGVGRLKTDERQVKRATGRLRPLERRVQGRSQLVARPRMADQAIEPRLQTFYPVNKEE